MMIKFMMIFLITTQAHAAWFSQQDIDTNKPKYLHGYKTEAVCKQDQEVGSCREYGGDIRDVQEINGNLSHSVNKFNVRRDAKQAAQDAKDLRLTNGETRRNNIKGVCAQDFSSLNAAEKNICWRSIFKAMELMHE